MAVSSLPVFGGCEEVARFWRDEKQTRLMKKKHAQKSRHPATKTRSTKPSRARKASPPARFRFDTIVVPIDFSSASLYPIQWAKFIAQRSKGRLHFVNAYSFPLPVASEWSPRRARLEARAIEEKIRRGLNAVALRHEVSPASFHARAGRPWSNVCHLAKEVQADLIVLSTHGRTGWERIFLGSTAEGVVRHSCCPVLVARQATARQKGHGRLRKILVPVDFSECAAPGLNYAIGLAQRFGSELVLLHVLQVINDPTPTIAYTRAEVACWAREDAEAQMAELLRRTDFSETKFTTVIKTGAPAQRVCQYARLISADLIVAATHGRTGLPRILVGSTAEQIVRYARTSVLVVPTCREKE